MGENNTVNKILIAISCLLLIATVGLIVFNKVTKKAIVVNTTTEASTTTTQETTTTEIITTTKPITTSKKTTKQTSR